MSDLLTNLNSIYTTKLQIKEAIGTSSDVFSDYPGYISSMVLPDGTAYITANGVSDISSYQYVDVNVPSSGGTEYQWIDPASYTMVIGEKYAFNGQLSANAQTQITADFTIMYPALAPYLNWYVYGIGGENNSSNWSKTAIIETPGDLPGHGVIAKGTWAEPVTGNPMFIVDELYAAKYAGGNGGLTIQNNGNQDVTRYSYVNVSVPSSGGTEYQWIELNTSTNSLTVDTAYSFNGQLGSASQTTVTAELVQQEPNLAPYIGYDLWEVLGIYNGNNTSKFIIADNISSYASYPIIVEGVTKSIFGSNMVIADHVYPTNFAGGNGSLTIQSNGNQDVTRYSYVNVNVSGGSGTSYEFIYLNNSDNNLWESSWSNLEVGSSYEFICRLNSSGYSDGTGDIPLGYYAYGMYKGGGDGRERPVCISGASSSLYSYELNNMVVRGDFVGKARLVDDTMTGIFSLGEMHYANIGGIGQKYISSDGQYDVSGYDEVDVEGITEYTIYDELDGKNPAPNGWYLTISDSNNSVTVYWLIILENAQSNVDVCFEFDITKVLAHVDIDTSNLNVHLTNWNGRNTVNFYTNASDMSDNPNPSFVTPWPLDQNDYQEISLDGSNICCIGFNENVSNGHNYFWFAHPSTAESI